MDFTLPPQTWATSSSTEYQDGGHKPEIVIT